ncbi:hypothetical protein E8E12_002213 [Didymella heteroderae]|uniref:Pentatricopeptide repeat protein n=1 Tax=Didymella heteroderae TaxID=1769908 RepID=A0A9P5BWM2_9PLEO|nr:hypothetical protein E8E12_002213 [Didymella heteroderae]
MLGSYVCRQCRARLNPRRVPARVPQWQPRATFISLRSKPLANDAAPTEAQTQPVANAKQDDQRPSYNLFDRTQTSNGPVSARSQRVGRYSRHLLDAEEDAPGVIDATAAGGANGAEDTGPAHTWRIRGLIKNQGINEAWKVFEKTYTSADCEALTTPSTKDIREINEKRFFGDVLTQTLKSFCKGQGESTVTPKRVLFKYEQLGIAPPGLWLSHIIEPLTHQVMLAANGAGKTLQRDLPSLLFELISVWRLFFQCKGVGNEPLRAISPKWNLPSLDAIPNVFQFEDFNYRLQDFHPKAVGSPMLGFCAVYLFNLSAAINANDCLKTQAAPFLDLLTRVLSGSRTNSVLKHAAYSKAFKTLPEAVQVEITKEIESAPSAALSALGRQLPNSAAKQHRSDKAHATTDLESFNLGAIARAVEAKTSPVVLEGHWKRIVRDYTQNGKTSIPPRIYNAFLSGYLILRQAPRSVEVWNHMMTHGVKPQVETWVAMLTGCERAKDLDGFNAMWQRLMASGLEPDAHAWTTRVHGLMGFRQIDIGLRALDEMGHRWRSAETVKNAAPSNSRNSKDAKDLPANAKLVNNCAKPTVEVINGAISGIVQLPQSARVHHQKRVDYVQKILRWGTQFGITPDTYTFNILIQMYFKVGDSATAFRVLKQMEQSGLQPDMATYGMLVTATFDNGSLDGLSEPDQASRLIKMFEEMEAGGLRLNNYIYATAIDRLLKHHKSHNAVRTLMDHMRSRNLSPSAYNYTSLITYYFQQSPPAIQAVDSLLQQVFDSPHTDTDKIMFDRAIEGYAEHGEVGKMMSVLTRMSKNGKHPGFQALTSVIRALVAAGDVDRARFIVRDVQRGEGIAHGGVTGAFNDQKHFLFVAQNLGIGIDEERMGDMLKMERRVLDEQIQVRMQEEKEAIEMQPEPQVSEQQSRGSWSSAPRPAPVQSEPELRDLGSPEEEIHGFLDSDTDARR